MPVRRGIRNGRVARAFIDLSLIHKFVLVIAVYLVLMGGLLSLSYGAMSTLSGLRAYVTGEGRWSASHRDAVYHLARYAVTRDENHYRAYEMHLRVPLGDQAARLELEQPNPDLAAVRQGLLEGQNTPADHGKIITLFRWFRHVSYMDKAIAVWAEGDGQLHELRRIGLVVHEEISSGHVTAARLNQRLDEIDAIRVQLTRLEQDFSSTLGEAARWLEGLLLQVMVGATAVFGAGASASRSSSPDISPGGSMASTRAPSGSPTATSAGESRSTPATSWDGLPPPSMTWRRAWSTPDRP